MYFQAMIQISLCQALSAFHQIADRFADDPPRKSDARERQDNQRDQRYALDSSLLGGQEGIHARQRKIRINHAENALAGRMGVAIRVRAGWFVFNHADHADLSFSAGVGDDPGVSRVFPLSGAARISMTSIAGFRILIHRRANLARIGGKANGAFV